MANYAYVTNKNGQCVIILCKEREEYDATLYENVKISYNEKWVKLSGNKINFVFIFSFGDPHTYKWFVDAYGEMANIDQGTYLKRKSIFSSEKIRYVKDDYHEMKERTYREIVSNTYTIKSDDYTIYETK